MTLEYSELLIIIGFLSITCILFITTSILKSRIINKLRETHNELEKKYLITKDRFLIIEENLLKLEKEKQEIADSLAIKDNQLSSLKATFAAKEENLQEKINYLEKIKDDLTLKFKDISTEIIKSQQDSFNQKQETTLTQILNPFKEQLNSFKNEVNQARTESIKYI